MSYKPRAVLFPLSLTLSRKGSGDNDTASATRALTLSRKGSGDNDAIPQGA